MTVTYDYGAETVLRLMLGISLWGTEDSVPSTHILPVTLNQIKQIFFFYISNVTFSVEMLLSY